MLIMTTMPFEFIRRQIHGIKACGFGLELDIEIQYKKLVEGD